MKKILLFSVLISSVIALWAQPTLTYETHRLLPGEDNPMTICSYMAPGASGENVTWDFSGLEAKKEFTGYIKEPVVNANFSTSNTQLIEFSTNFFFEIDETGIFQTGYASNNFNTVVEYTQPFEKMNYPFSYGDSYTKPFSGEYYYKEKEMGTITGTGQVEADAWGKLILPNTTYDNTVRVKTTKSYTTAYSSSSNENSVEIVTYRWYNNVHRYPLLVLTEFITNSGTRTNTHYQAAYNNSALKSATLAEDVVLNEESIRLYPNPSEKELYLEVQSESNVSAMISIYDISGKLVVGEKEYGLTSGTNTIDLSGNLSVLKPGSYLVNIVQGGERIVKDLLVVN